MDLVKNYKEKNIGSFYIKQNKWNNDGDCLDWILDGDSWLRFRISGTEPKFKVYYNLYAKDKNTLINEYEKIDLTLKKLLDIK
jgi:phosphomannomutase